MIRGSLRRRLFLVVFLALIPIFVVHVIVLILADMRTATARTTSNTQDIAAAAMPLLQSTLIVGDLATTQETLDRFMRHGQFRSLRLLDQGGERILVEGRPGFSSAAESVPEWFVDWLDFRFPVQRFPLQVGGTPYGILVAEPASIFLVADIWQRMWTAATLWLVTLSFSLWMLRLTLNRSLRPLDDLTTAVRRFGEGDLHCRAPVSAVPELAETSIAFNRMADNLSDARDRLEERVSQATQELENLITRIPVGVFKLRMLAGGGMRFDYVSPRWCELLEITADEAYRDALAAMSRVHPDEADAFLRLHESARATLAPFRWEGRMRDGMRVRWLRIESTPTVLDDGDILWEGIQHDITATKERESELERFAHYDALTGLPNRSLLTDRLQQAMAQTVRLGTHLAVVYLDLDGFKSINDLHGHDAGDHLLVVAADRMKHALREGDTLARIGGDEFVAVLFDLPDVDACVPLLKRLLSAAAEEVMRKGCALRVSASLGVTFFPQHGEADSSQLLRQADQAMYQAKMAGKNRFCFYAIGLGNTSFAQQESLEFSTAA